MGSIHEKKIRTNFVLCIFFDVCSNKYTEEEYATVYIYFVYKTQFF